MAGSRFVHNFAYGMTALSIAVMVPGGPSFAFEGREHNLIGNLSLAVVDSYLCAQYRPSQEDATDLGPGPGPGYIDKANDLLEKIRKLKAELEETIDRDTGVVVPANFSSREGKPRFKIADTGAEEPSRKCHVPSGIRSVIRGFLPITATDGDKPLEGLKFPDFLAEKRGDSVRKVARFFGVESARSTDSSYGKLIEHVDYLSQPLRLLMDSERASAHPEDDDFLLGLPDARADLERFLRETDKTGNLLNASHNNSSHFQGHLLTGIRFWHRKAIEIATGRYQPAFRERTRPEKRLFAALMANGIGDHYLHDFFAPGHLLSPRDNFPDQPAMAIHDAANKHGAELVPDPENVDVLRPILGHLRQAGRCADNVGKNTAFGFKCTTLETMSEVLRGEKRRVKLYGDNELFTEDGTLKSKQDPEIIEKQVLLMVLVQVRSVLDVVLPTLPSTVGDRSTKRNHFETLKWFPRSIQFPDKDYDCDDHNPHSCRLKDGVVDIELAYRVGALNWFCKEVAVEGDGVCGAENHEVEEPVAALEFGEYAFKDGDSLNADPIIGFDVARETFLSGHKPGRWTYTLGIMPWGIPGSPDFLRDRKTKESVIDDFLLSNVGLTLNGTFIDGRDYNAYGPGTRLVKSFPKTDTQLSAYFRYMYFNTDKRDFWRPAYGIRGDIGFSMLTAFLALGRDYGLDDRGNFDSGTVMATGLTFSFPLSRSGY